MEMKNTNINYENNFSNNYSNINNTVEICSYILENIIKFTNQKAQIKTSIFDSDIHQRQSIPEYIKRIVKYFEIDENILILTMMNLDKLMLNNENLTINKLNCYKIFFASLLETNKLYDDFVIPKNILCKVALIDSSELLSLETEFLEKVNYNLYIEENEFYKYKIKLNNLHQKIKIELEKQKAEQEIKEKQRKEFVENINTKCGYYNFTKINNNHNLNTSHFMNNSTNNKNFLEL